MVKTKNRYKTLLVLVFAWSVPTTYDSPRSQRILGATSASTQAEAQRHVARLTSVSAGNVPDLKVQLAICDPYIHGRGRCWRTGFVLVGTCTARLSSVCVVVSGGDYFNYFVVKKLRRRTRAVPSASSKDKRPRVLRVFSTFFCSAWSIGTHTGRGWLRL